MKSLAAGLFLVLITSFTVAGAWDAGEYEVQLPFGHADVELFTISQEGIEVGIQWENDTRPDISKTLWRFKDGSDSILQFEADTYAYELKKTTFGDLILSTKIDDQTKSAFLKPVPPAITSIEQYPTDQAITDLPSAETWQNYANDDLWKYWGQDSALSFPTYRCNNGQAIDLDNLCYELRTGWIAAGLEYSYTRMLSRQIYTYGVIYHMTGNEDAFEIMLLGLEQLTERVESNGSIKTVLASGEAIYSSPQRTSQDLAYAQMGFAMAYYLTGDQTWLTQLNTTKNHIIDTYYRDDWGMLAWTMEDQMPGDANNQELVAQLDQLNAYMLLVYQHLPAELKPEWETDIRLMVDALLEHFHDEDRHRFAGKLDKGEFNDPGDRHNDFGHSVKTYWMIYTAGQMLGDATYIEVGAWGIDHIARAALRFREMPRGLSHWGNQTQSNSSSWWEFAELTQATASLALQYNDYARALPDIYDMWLENFVDKNYGGVWMSDRGGAKQHLWKNGYHEAEIGLIALITSQALKGEPIDLYFKRATGHFQPYFYPITVKAINDTEDGSIVTFQ